jgi:hypothetical protein
VPARADKLRQRRARTQERAELIALTDKALQALAQLLDSGKPSLRLRAAIHVLTASLGPVDQHEVSNSSGDLEFRLLALVTRAREQKGANGEGDSPG